MMTAYLCTYVCRNQHITATLRDSNTLHWLPVPQRILFKVALVTFYCVRGRGPGYFDDVLVPVHTIGARAQLQSADHGDMVVLRSCTMRFGQCSFRSSAPSVLNDLPPDLKNSDISRQGFKSYLKSWLFWVCLLVTGTSAHSCLRDALVELTDWYAYYRTEQWHSLFTASLPYLMCLRKALVCYERAVDWLFIFKIVLCVVVKKPTATTTCK